MRQKGFAPLIILTVVFLLVVIGYLFSIKGNININLPKPSASVIPSASLSTTPDSTANWETYTDTRLKYSVQYPKDWSTDKVCLGGIAGDDYLCLKSPGLVIDGAGNVSNGELIFIGGPGSSVFIDGELTPDRYCLPQPLGGKIKSCTSVTVGGKKAIERVFLDFPFVDVAVVDNNQIMLTIRLQLQNGGTSQTIPVIFDQILSTFEFTK